jgi:tetratricopeptide (TPR) repeat protein
MGGEARQGLSLRFAALPATLALFLAASAPAPATADSGWATATFKQAESLAAAGQYEQALALYQQIIAREPTAKLSYCRAGTAAAGTGALPLAIDYDKTCKQLFPNSIEPRGELVKLYQITGDLAARDRERQELLYLHRASADPQAKAADHYLRDIFAVGAQNIAVWEYFDLVGAWPSRYRFFVLSDTGNTLYSLGLSSSTAANLNAEKLLGHPTKNWVFHLDLENRGTVTTLKVFDGEPGYDAVKPLVIEAIRQQETAKAP